VEKIQCGCRFHFSVQYNKDQVYLSQIYVFPEINYSVFYHYSIILMRIFGETRYGYYRCLLLSTVASLQSKQIFLLPFC
jgi:hypothetical protein